MERNGSGASGCVTESTYSQGQHGVNGNGKHSATLQRVLQLSCGTVSKQYIEWVVLLRAHVDAPGGPGGKHGSDAQQHRAPSSERGVGDAGPEEIFGDAITANRYTGDLQKSITARKSRIDKNKPVCDIAIVFKRKSFS